MGSIKTLRSEIERSMMLFGFNLTQLSKLADIKTGNLSTFLKKNRPIPIQQLDRITRAFGYGDGWFYPLYVDECFSNEKVIRHKMVSYLIRCSELSKFNCINLVMPRLLEDQKNIDILFSVAESLFDNGKKKESAFFYQIITEHEKDSHSERLAISHYKLFRVYLGKNAEENWKAIIQFHPFRKRVPERFQLDALLQLSTICFTLHRWKEVETYADELRELAEAVYNDELRKSNNNIIEPLTIDRHLVVYYGQGYLLKSVALEMQGQYEKSKKYLQGYADLSWFKLLDDVGKREVEKFSVWGKANLYTLDLLSGNINILTDYVDFLENHSEEILPALITIVQSANIFKFSIDDILERFSDSIISFDSYRDPINVSRYLQFRYHKSKYEFENSRIGTGIDDILRCIALADIANHHEEYKRSLKLFWKYKDYASDQQIDYFQKIMDGGCEDEETFIFVSRVNQIN
ncbi:MULTISPECIES: DNA-binding protein [Brevibacillus]|uniref:DNA-binding protein n=1 Tax=Brevibacillus TaxID=55080 RepID=UPI000EABD75B|nr:MULTISPECIES: DNA-binding protein [Brevibacillus]AYK06561.1 DNA-binding protein [Brevibacillus laterosporus]MCR8963957.1 DNA-binding protein [Brevibacillus laterosporus]MCZ0836112.1 DNA-binding protein [Brevibacillus halotolerans]MDF9412497.1 DNA-binding protein [Brevibacillus laterosporus]